MDLSRVDLFRLAAEVISVYAANLRLVRLLAREYRFRPIFFWQPVITTKRFRTPDEQRWENDYTTDPARRRTLWYGPRADPMCPSREPAEHNERLLRHEHHEPMP